MKRAKLIIDGLQGFKGHAALYQLNPPIKDDDNEEYEYVIASAVVALFSGPETLIFPATKDGEVINFRDIAGERGTLNHTVALNNEGYTVFKEDT